MRVLPSESAVEVSEVATACERVAISEKRGASWPKGATPSTWTFDAAESSDIAVASEAVIAEASVEACRPLSSVAPAASREDSRRASAASS